MGVITKYLFKKNPIFNTFIGGLGSLYPTPTDLASILSITSASITNYRVDGSNNISCFIKSPYNLNTGVLSSKPDFTYYIDADGLAIEGAGSSTMRANTSLRQLYFPTIGVIGDLFGNSSWNTQPFWGYCAFNSLTTIRNTAFSSATELKYLILPSLTTIYVQNGTRSNMASMTALEILYIPNVTTFDWWYIGITTFLNIKTGCVILAHPDLETIAKSNKQVTINHGFLVLGDTITINGLTYTLVATKTNNTEFEAGTSSLGTCQNLSASINADTRTGTLGDVTGSTGGGSTMAVITNIVGAAGDATTISTSNAAAFSFSGSTFTGGGGRHPAIAYAEDTRGCDIRYVDDFSSVDPPTSLSASNITASSFDLNFTPPAPNVNGNFKYEVWLNDGKTAWMPFVAYDLVDGTGATISGLSSGTYAVKVRTADGFYNLSAFTTPFNVTI